MQLHTYTPLLAISEGLARTVVWHCIEQSALLALWGSVPRTGRLPPISSSSRNLQQMHLPVPNRDQCIFILLCARCSLLAVVARGWSGHAQGFHVVGVGMVSNVVVQLVCSDHVGGQGQCA